MQPPNSHVYHLLVSPRMMSACKTALSDLGVLGSVDLQEYQMGLIPLENDLLSLEAEDTWKKLTLVCFVLFECDLVAESLLSDRMAITHLYTIWEEL